MSKALEINGVNFATNKLATISFSEIIPCTALALNKSTSALTAIGATDTLTATPTPANTTDNVSWASSNTSAVTVNNGVITAVGIGSATITATCGSQSATCAVTVVNVLEYDYSIARYNFGQQYETAGRDYVYQSGASGSKVYCAIYNASHPTTKRIWSSNQATAGNMYPILLGAGASQVSITVPNTIRATAWFTNSEEACDYSQESSGAAVYAKELGGDRSAYDSNVPLGNRVISTIPEGADSISLSLQYPGGEITDDIMATVVITVS